MRSLLVKSDRSNIKMKFDTHDYGRNKGHDWRIYINYTSYVTVGHSQYSEFHPNKEKTKNTTEYENEICLHGLNIKDLERLEKWIKNAKEEFLKRNNEKAD